MSSLFKDDIITEMVCRCEKFEELLDFLIGLYQVDTSNDPLGDKMKIIGINAWCQIILSRTGELKK